MSKDTNSIKAYSSKLQKVFDTPELALQAEQEYETALVAKKEAEVAKATERKARAKEVEKQLQVVSEAREKYNALLEDFCKDFGEFHINIKGGSPLIRDLWRPLSFFNNPFSIFDW